MLFEDVKAIYSDYPDVKVLNIAISDITGTVKFLPSKELQGWTTGISHITSENHSGTRLSEIENNIKLYGDEIEVKSSTIHDLLTQYNITHIDYMKIDTEGHEKNIIDGHDWSVKPTAIKLEHSHINDITMKAKLESLGYMVTVETNDIYAVC